MKFTRSQGSFIWYNPSTWLAECEFYDKSSKDQYLIIFYKVCTLVFAFYTFTLPNLCYLVFGPNFKRNVVGIIIFTLATLTLAVNAKLTSKFNQSDILYAVDWDQVRCFVFYFQLSWVIFERYSRYVCVIYLFGYLNMFIKLIVLTLALQELIIPSGYEIKL